MCIYDKSKNKYYYYYYYLPACTGPGGIYLWSGGYLPLVKGGVCLWSCRGVCLCSRGVSASGPWGVSASVPRGCVCIPACNGADTTPCGQKFSHTLLKILPCPNFIAVGNKTVSLLLYIYVSQLLLVELSTQAR